MRTQNSLLSFCEILVQNHRGAPVTGLVSKEQAQALDRFCPVTAEY